MNDIVTKSSSRGSTLPIGSALLALFAWVLSSLGCSLGLGLSAASAEFVQTSPGVLQSSDLVAKVIISYRVPGIFVLAGSPIDFQLFDPAALELPSGNEPHSFSHVFIEYDPAQDRYIALHVGQRSFRIKGGFSLIVSNEGSASGKSWQQRITVDNNNPYLSIVHEPRASSSERGSQDSLQGAQPDLLGFRGLQLVVKKTGQRYAALLEANQFNELKGLIEPYTLSAESLQFKGEEFSGTSVGVDIEPAKNICLQSGTSFLAQSEALDLRRSQDRNAALKELEDLLKQGASKDPFRGALLLRITPQEIIALDYRKDRAMVVRPLPKGTQPVCMIEEVSLE